MRLIAIDVRYIRNTHQEFLFNVVGRLTCAHDSCRVRVPPPICSTHCPYPPSWDKPWVTPEEYLSSLKCVLICLNETIYWESRVIAVGWRE